MGNIKYQSCFIEIKLIEKNMTYTAWLYILKAPFLLNCLRRLLFIAMLSISKQSKRYKQFMY